MWKIVLPSSDTANARPRAKSSAARVTMNARHAGSRDEQPVDESDDPAHAQGQGDGDEASVLRSVRREDRGQGKQRTDREVDPAADDDEGHPDRDQAEERTRLEDVQEVVDARELASRRRTTRGR